MYCLKCFAMLYFIHSTHYVLAEVVVHNLCNDSLCTCKLWFIIV